MFSWTARWGRRFVIVAWITLVACCAARWAIAAPEQSNEPLAPQEITLRTPDDMTLVATFYPSKLGKNAVPVILLHGAKGSRADFEELAAKLQRAGQAVIAPDLRGHGDSAIGPDGGRIVDLRYPDYEAMVSQDMEAVNKFLLARNNAGELNVDKLCVVALDASAVIALNWAALDWSWPPLTTGKQGQDVKALVLVSPEFSVKGLRAHEALNHPNVRSDLSMIFIVGKTSKSMSDSRRVYTALERHHAATAAEAADRQTLFLRTPQTALQGARLLHEKGLKVDDMILKFVELRLVKQHIVWNERKTPHE